MGGIVTHDVAKISDNVNGPVVLTPDAVTEFARRGVFFDITPGVISDKSKANLLGKGLSMYASGMVPHTMHCESCSWVSFGAARGTYNGPRGLRFVNVCPVVGGESLNTRGALRQLIVFV